MNSKLGPVIPAALSTFVRFTYKNWRGSDHVYEIEVESLQYGPFVKDGIDKSDHPISVWAIHGHIVTRDGDERPEMGENRRRTFLLDDIRDPTVIS